MSRQKNVETQASVGSIVACPSCSDLVAEAGVNAHLDECLARGRDLERETRVASMERDHSQTTFAQSFKLLILLP